VRVCPPGQTFLRTVCCSFSRHMHCNIHPPCSGAPCSARRPPARGSPDRHSDCIACRFMGNDQQCVPALRNARIRQSSCVGSKRRRPIGFVHNQHIRTVVQCHTECQAHLQPLENVAHRPARLYSPIFSKGLDAGIARAARPSPNPASSRP